MRELPPLAREEEVGRAVWDSKKARKAAAGSIHPKIFRENDGIRDLSVDRVSRDGLDDLSTLHDGESLVSDFKDGPPFLLNMLLAGTAQSNRIQLSRAIPTTR